MNPAVSLAMCSMGKLPWPHFPFYAAVQTLGAFLGSGLCFFLYLDQLNNFDDGIRTVNGPKETASIFCSFPKQHVSHPTGL
jgi:glycerol uptake facilitator-like aquaporin